VLHRDGQAVDEQAVLDRIRAGLVYTESEASFQAAARRTDLIFEYNHTPPGEADRRRSLLAAILGPVGERAVLLPPFHAGFGSNVYIGDDFFGNVNLTFVDDVDIRIGVGSVVSRDIPPMVVAVGTPCRVARPITDDDLTTRTAAADPEASYQERE
jgi:galactoside O-acetyltransferase